MEENKDKKVEEVEIDGEDLDMIEESQKIASKHNPKLGEIYKRFYNFEEE